MEHLNGAAAATDLQRRFTGQNQRDYDTFVKDLGGVRIQLSPASS
jgi:hypothetical protein